jgi:type II restriction enzyme
MKNCLKESLSKVPPKWKSQSKIFGEACEFWIEDHFSCPSCRHGTLLKLETNKKSIDHRCLGCGENFQVKASRGSFSKKDGSVGFLGAEYNTTLTSIGKWGLILVEYDKDSSSIRRTGVVPKDSITKENIIPRKPLSQAARRAGWQGCNIIFCSDVVSWEVINESR